MPSDVETCNRRRVESETSESHTHRPTMTTSRSAPATSPGFSPTFRAGPAPVAQGIERRFPKPCVAGSNPAGGTSDSRPKQVILLVGPDPVIDRRCPPLAAVSDRDWEECGKDFRRSVFPMSGIDNVRSAAASRRPCSGSGARMTLTRSWALPRPSESEPPPAADGRTHDRDASEDGGVR